MKALQQRMAGKGVQILKNRHLRSRRTKDEIRQLESQILDVLSGDHPQSIRHVFYRMTDPRLPVPIAKTDQGYKQVQNRITSMRRSGLLRYDWIADSSRHAFHVHTFQDAGELIRAFGGLYRADLWKQTEVYCEVWVESRSIAGILRRDCEELAVSLYPCVGFASLTFLYDAAQEINLYAETKESVEIIYIGDYDPAGVLIDQKVEAGLREHVYEDLEINFHRVAINPDQIREYDLPSKPRNARDRRRLDIQETVEAEAMPAATLRAILRDRIEDYLPEDALEVAKEVERHEQEGLEMLGELVSERGLGDIMAGGD